MFLANFGEFHHIRKNVWKFEFWIKSWHISDESRHFSASLELPPLNNFSQNNHNYFSTKSKPKKVSFMNIRNNFFRCSLRCEQCIVLHTVKKPRIFWGGRLIAQIQTRMGILFWIAEKLRKFSIVLHCTACGLNTIWSLNENVSFLFCNFLSAIVIRETILLLMFLQQHTIHHWDSSFKEIVKTNIFATSSVESNPHC